jgi:hypothetical protein
MQEVMKRSVPLAALACVVIAAIATGCAQPSQTTNGGLLANRDPQHIVSRDHWELIQVPDERFPVAAIVDSTSDVTLSVSCDDKGLLLMGPDSPQPQRKDPSIGLSWDGEVGPVGMVHSFKSSYGWGFGTDENYPGFWPLMEHLKQHRVLEVTVSAAGTEPLHYRFSLVQADEAIDSVFSTCGRKSPI